MGGRRTLEIRAAEFPTSEIGDAPMLPELLNQIPPQQEIATVTADGAFDTRKYHDAIAERGAAAIIPPHKNARPWKPGTAGLPHAMKSCAHRSVSVEPSGDDGSVTTAEAVQKPRCLVSSSSGSACRRGNSTVRLQGSRSVSSSSTASPPSAHSSQRSQAGLSEQRGRSLNN